MLNGEVVLLADLSPVVLLLMWQHKYNLQLIAVGSKSLNGVHEHRLAVQWHKLLGQVASHAQSFAASHNNNVVHSRKS